MSQTIRNGQSLDLSLTAGQSIGLCAAAGTYSASVVAGTYAGTVLATNSSNTATFGPYATGAVVRVKTSDKGATSYDIATTPDSAWVAGSPVVSSVAPSDADGRPDGTIYIQTV